MSILPSASNIGAIPGIAAVRRAPDPSPLDYPPGDDWAPDVLREWEPPADRDPDDEPPTEDDRAWWASITNGGFDRHADPEWSPVDEARYLADCPCETCELIRALEGR